MIISFLVERARVGQLSRHPNGCGVSPERATSLWYANNRWMPIAWGGCSRCPRTGTYICPTVWWPWCVNQPPTIASKVNVIAAVEPVGQLVGCARVRALAPLVGDSALAGGRALAGGAVLAERLGYSSPTAAVASIARISERSVGVSIAWALRTKMGSFPPTADSCLSLGRCSSGYSEPTGAPPRFVESSASPSSVDDLASSAHPRTADPRTPGQRRMVDWLPYVRGPGTPEWTATRKSVSRAAERKALHFADLVKRKFDRSLALKE